MKKYELVKNENCLEGFFQIKALKDFSNVKVGDLGGFVESEANLCQFGNCWISEQARVYGQACVFGNARVYRNVQIYDDARVFGNADVDNNTLIGNDAKVFGNARVYGSACIYGHAQVYDNARVYGSACISGSAHLFGDVKVFGKSEITNRVKISTGEVDYMIKSIQGSRYPLNFDGDKKHLYIGCERHTIQDWKKNYKSIGEIHNLSDDQIEEYKKYIDLAKDLLL